MSRPTTTKWPPAKGVKYVGKWPPRFRTPPVKPLLHGVRLKPRDRKPDYIRAMIEKHGSREAWERVRGGSYNA
jgi:hypothetical protein